MMLLLLACTRSIVDSVGDSSTDSPVDTWPFTCAQRLLATASGPIPATRTSLPVCTDPQPRGFVEVGEDWGLPAGPDPDAEHNKGGVAVALDLDHDGDVDLVLGFAGQPLIVYWNQGGSFQAQVLSGTSGSNPVALADIDGDGWLDLVSAGPPEVLIRNRGGELSVHGMNLPLGAPITEFAAGDLNGDGFMDLLGTAAGMPTGEPSTRADRLFLGDGDGSFEITELRSEHSGGMGFEGVIFDADGDGDLDLYTVNDLGSQVLPNVLWRNAGDGTFLADTDCACGVVVSGMGGDIADINGDGLPEIYVSATGHNLLLQALPDGTWVDITEATGADPLRGIPTMGWASIFWDYDDDGDQDILVAEGDLWYGDQSGEFDYSVKLLVDEEGQYVDRSAELGLDARGSWRAVVPADFNGDGQVDLLITDVVGRPRLYLATGCTGNAALEVQAPLHSRVEVCVDGETQVAWVRTESSWGGAKPQQARIGLGTGSLEAVAVTLPDGTVLASDDVDPDTRLTW